MSNWQWIIILMIAVIGAIFIPKNNGNYRNYNCYDRCLYKCFKCKKNCIWHNIAMESEKIIRDMEDKE